MKILLSPAKFLDLSSELPSVVIEKSTQSEFLEQSTIIQEELKPLGPEQIAKLMGLSDKLAHLNWERNQEWQTPFNRDNARPAIYTFSGDVYSGFDIQSFPVEKIDKLQDSVRILSGLYGILKPLDLMQAYRLEMGTSISIQKNKNLYEFWSESLTQSLESELTQDEIIVNLASQEYSKALDLKALASTHSVVNPIFKDWKNDKLKIISFYAKKARGVMARYLIESEANTIEDIQKFNLDSYSYSPEHTIDSLNPVFIR